MNDIESFYDRNPQYEWERLEHHRMEFAVTLRTFKDYLPPAPAKILDIGGGPGRSTIALTQLGYYEVTLFDLSKGCLELAKQKDQEAGARIAAFEHGDARDLSRFGNEGFDAVLLMGLLYHLLEDAERRQAIREARRVLKPKGFETLDLVAFEGVISMIEEKINELTGEASDAWVKLDYQLSKDPSLHGCVEHLLYVGRKL